VPGEPPWTIGAPAITARADRDQNLISKYRDGGLSFDMKWIHNSFEAIDFTVRDDGFAIRASSWAEHDNDGGKMTTDNGGKVYVKSGACTPACPKLGDFKAHTAKFRVLGPTPDPAALSLAADPAWAKDPN
jgi:hypothetical protein